MNFQRLVPRFFLARPVRRHAALALALGVSFLAITSSHGVVRTWNGGGADNNTSTGGNWGGTAPLAGDDLAFAGSIRLTPNQVAALAVRSLSFNSGAGAFTIGGALYTIGVGGITNNSANTQTINNALTLSSIQTWSATSGNLVLGGNVANGGFLLTIGGSFNTSASGVISGTGGLTKSGAGTLTLSGVNTFTGGMTISQGTVSVGTIGNANTAQPLGAVPSVTLGSSGQNGTLQYTGPSVTINMPFTLAAGGTGTIQIDDANAVLTRIVQATGSGGLIKSGPGTLRAPADTYSGNTTVNAGILQMDSGANPNTTYYLNGGIILDNSGFFNRPIIVTADGSGLDGTDRTYSGTLTSSGGDYTLNINASPTATSLTMAGTVTAGPGLTLLLDVQKGSLILASSAVFATDRVSLQLESATTLDMNKFNATFGSLSGSGTVSDTAGGGGATTVLTLAGTGTATFSGVIENGTKITALVKTNTGIQTLSGVNTYTGGTTINGGTLVATNPASLGAASGVLTLNAGTLEVSTGFTSTRNITLGDAASTFQVDPSQTFTTTGVISGSGALNKTGTGTMILSGVNTYTGATNVSAGTLQISTSDRIANTSDLTVSGGTFGLQTFNDTVRNVTLSSGSITGTGTLTASSYAVQSGTASPILAGSGATMIKTTAGTVTLTGANTFTGATTVSGGILTLASGSGSALGSTSGITVNSGGTLLLGASNQINNTAPITLAGGTFAKGNFSEGSTSTAGLGALTLSATGSHLDFGTGTVGTLTFASFTPGTFSLTIDNWTGTPGAIGSSGTDRLIFSSNQSANLSGFSFAGYAPGAMEFSLGGGYYEITPVTAVPEPSTLLTALFAFGALCYGQRRRWQQYVREGFFPRRKVGALR